MSKSDREWLRVESEPGKERREKDVRQGGQSEVREWKVYGFSWEVLIFADFSYDFSQEVLKFTISTFHFIVCFEHLTKKGIIFMCVLRATGAKYYKIHKWFSEISDSMVQKHMFWASPRRGTDGRTQEQSASSSALWRDAWEYIQIRAVQEWQRMIESGIRARRRKEREECETERTEWGERVKNVWF